MSLCAPNSLQVGRSQEIEVELMANKEDVSILTDEEDDPFVHWQVSSEIELWNSIRKGNQSLFDDKQPETKKISKDTSEDEPVLRNKESSENIKRQENIVITHSLRKYGPPSKRGCDCL